MSVTWAQDDITLTLVADEDQLRLHDLLLRLAARQLPPEPETVSPEGLDEERWWRDASGSAARGIASSLTLPLDEPARARGCVDLYGASARAFEGHHEQLAEILGATASEAVRNADLSFHTRELATSSPEVLRDRIQVDLAVGVLSSRLEVDAVTARRLLVDAAALAGLTVRELADLLVDAHG